MQQMKPDTKVWKIQRLIFIEAGNVYHEKYFLLGYAITWSPTHGFVNTAFLITSFLDILKTEAVV